MAPKGPLQSKRCSTLDTRSETADTHPDASRVRAPTSTVVAVLRGNSPSAVAAGKPHGELPRLCALERSEGGFSKVGARSRPKERRHRPPCCSESPAGRTLCRADGTGRGVESRRLMGVLSRPLSLNPLIQIPLLSRSRRRPSSDQTSEA